MSTPTTPEPSPVTPPTAQEPVAVAPTAAPVAVAPLVTPPTPVVIPSKATRQQLGDKLNALQKDALTHTGKPGHNPFIWLKENLTPLRLELEAAKIPTASIEARINALKYTELPVIIAKGITPAKDKGPVDHAFQNNLTIVQPKTTGLAT